MDRYVRTPKQLDKIRLGMKMVMIMEVIFFGILCIMNIAGVHITFTDKFLIYPNMLHVFMWVFAFACYCKIADVEFIYMFLAISLVSLLGDMISVLWRIYLLHVCNTRDCASVFMYGMAWVVELLAIILLFVDIAYLVLSALLLKQTKIFLMRVDDYMDQMGKVMQLSEKEGMINPSDAGSGNTAGATLMDSKNGTIVGNSKKYKTEVTHRSNNSSSSTNNKQSKSSNLKNALKIVTSRK